MVSGITQVFRRISEIESRFGKASANVSFQDFLQEADKAHGSKALGTYSAGHLEPAGEVVDLVRQSAHKYGVDPALAEAVAKTESDFSPEAVSEAGAVGVMQLMPETAAALGVTDPYNARQNVEGGVKYIKQLLNTFDGDVTKAVAAYNAGPQAVKAYNGVPPYAETQDYVKKVLDIYR